MGTRSETASCPHSRYVHTSTSSVIQQEEGLWFTEVAQSLLKLDKSVEIYDKKLLASKTCARLRTCPSPKQSC